MALIKTIENILPEVKRHLRIFHEEDDILIKNEIEASILDIFTMIRHIPEKLEDGKDNPEFPTDDGDNPYIFDPRELLAIKHCVAMYRSNPDERIEIQAGRTTTTNRVIERILGSRRRYLKC